MSGAAPISTLQLSLENPWPGLRSFDEGAREFFFGRQGEIDALLRMVRRERLTVFYGRSGLGKTSLLQAGLFPQLRAAALLPVMIRLEYTPVAPHPVEQIKAALARAFAAGGIDARPPAADETLWEYFYSKDVDFWDEQNRLVVPVIVFDQFEERFTLARRDPAIDARAAETIQQLSELIENRTPAAVRARFEASPEAVNAFDFRKQACKIILSLREDFLAELESLRERFPTLVSSRFRLQGMTSAQALDVILKPGGHLVTEPIAREIVSFVAGNPAGQLVEDVVEPVLLSVVLAALNDRRRRAGQGAITAALLSGSREEILEGFYTSTLAGLPDNARLLVEEGLLTTTGRRDSVAWEDALAEFRVDEPTLQALIDRHLVRREDRSGGTRVELVHDRIAEVVLASRNRRRQEAAREADRRQQLELRRRLARVRRNATLAGAAALVLAGVIAIYWLGYVRPSVSYAKEFNKVFGQPAELGPISAAATRHRSSSLKFIRRGWFGPVIAVEAVDSAGELTPHHQVGTFLSNSEDDDAREQECRWEFVYDPDGRVVYEVARDRFGRMVWGFVYSPPADSDGAPLRERTATYVGSDGLPQPQGRSRAEFITFTYDDRGYEIQHRYVDRDKQPIPGRDRAYGHNFIRDEKGRAVEWISVDRDGQPMDDEAGNAIFRLEYNDADEAVVSAAYGANRRPTLFSASRTWKRHTTYDRWGNVTSSRSFNLDDQPATSAESQAHEVRYEYDERGNQVAVRFFDIAGRKIVGWGNYAHLIRRSYDDRNRLIAEQYFDEEDQPFGSRHWFDEVRFAYDERQMRNGWSYFDAEGKPTVNGFDVHRIAAIKDEFGQELERRFFGPDGQPVAAKRRGVHLERKRYDGDGNQTEIACFDVAGEPCVDADAGYHRHVFTHDSFGHVRRYEYFGLDGPINAAPGFQEKHCAYDSTGALVKVQYFDAEDAPVDGPEGAPEVRYAYDVAGNKTVEEYRDAAGAPINDRAPKRKFHYHRVVAEYNSFRQVVREQFFGPDGERVPGGADGVPEVRYTYDSNGEKSEIRYFGEPDQQTVNHEGVWRTQLETDAMRKVIRKIIERRGADGWFNAELGVRTRRDILDGAGDLLEIAYYDSDDKLTVGPDQFARKEFIREERGVTQKYYGPGEWLYPDFGVAIKVEILDAAGKLIDDTFRGADGSLVMGPLGFARDEVTHYEDGRVLHVLRDAQNQEQFIPALGFARVMTRPLGRQVVRVEYSGVGGTPVAGVYGYARREFDVDARHQLIADAYFDAAGQPTWGVDGYHRMTKDPATGEVRYFDIAGQPMAAPDETNLVRLAYHLFVDSTLAESFRAGFRPGDILWSAGTWRYADSMRAAVADAETRAEVDKLMLRDFWQAIAEAGEGDLRTVVLRAGELVQLALPAKSADAIFSKEFKLRSLPRAALEGWLQSIEAKEAAASTTIADAPGKAP